MFFLGPLPSPIQITNRHAALMVKASEPDHKKIWVPSGNRTCQWRNNHSWNRWFYHDFTIAMPMSFEDFPVFSMFGDTSIMTTPNHQLARLHRRPQQDIVRSQRRCCCCGWEWLITVVTKIDTHHHTNKNYKNIIIIIIIIIKIKINMKNGLCKSTTHVVCTYFGVHLWTCSWMSVSSTYKVCIVCYQQQGKPVCDP